MIQLLFLGHSTTKNHCCVLKVDIRCPEMNGAGTLQIRVVASQEDVDAMNEAMNG